jgi:hypothetical protein
MSKSTASKQSGWGPDAPGTKVCSLDADKDREWGLVSVYVSVPILGQLTGSFLRFNLFADVSGTEQHVASAICPAGTTGEIIVVSGHVADTWHVYVQATRNAQEAKVSIAARPCCAPPMVRVRPDLLGLAFAGSEVGLGALEWFPVVPWGVEFGASKTFVVSGSGTQAFPAGARLNHWQVQGTGGPPNTIELDAQSAGPLINVGNTAPARESFPQAEYVTQVVFVNLLFGVFDIVV